MKKISILLLTFSRFWSKSVQGSASFWLSDNSTFSGMTTKQKMHNLDVFLRAIVSVDLNSNKVQAKVNNLKILVNFYLFPKYKKYIYFLFVILIDFSPRCLCPKPKCKSYKWSLAIPGGQKRMKKVCENNLLLIYIKINVYKKIVLSNLLKGSIRGG